MLDHYAHDLDLPIIRRYAQRCPTFVVLRTYIRTVFEQHACDRPTLRRFVQGVKS
jgi:hypothetical protein